MFAIDPGYLNHRVAQTEQPIWQHNLPAARLMTFRYSTPTTSVIRMTVTMRVYAGPRGHRRLLLKLPLDVQVMTRRHAPVRHEDGSAYITVRDHGHTQTVRILPGKELRAR